MRGTFFFPAIFTLAVLALPATAANVKLYTTDGEFQMVREYHVEGDRVKFYSVERSEWEEVPASMVDLKRTEAESSAKKEVLDRQAKELDDEAAAARAEREELAKVPKDPGVYLIENGEVRTFKVADISVHNAKGRAALRLLSPVPIVSGKATIELAGEHAANIVHADRPEFFFQLSKEQSFGIIKLTPQKGVRIAERLTFLPVVNETEEERDSVQIFTKQLAGDNFYKIWPEEPLAAGEYAVIEYVESKVEMQIWDFRIE
jgi:hypothetical protein